VIPRESKELVLKNTEVTRFWNLLDSFAREIRQEYVKKIPDGGTPSDNIVRAMAIGRIAALEEVLGEKPTQA
jgi:hypothetical protein